MINEEQHIEFSEQIVRYLSGEMSPSEAKEFEEVLHSDTEKNAEFLAFQSVWDGVGRAAVAVQYDMDKEWSLLEGKIDFGEEKKTISLSGYIVRIAALLLIGLAGIAGWFSLKNYLSYEQVALEIGTEEVKLPDGSILTLNAGSEVRFLVDEHSGDRRVVLEGEAFFEIARDTARPFIIDAGQASVRVLGTSFNVNADAENNTVEVTVTSGLVSMSSKRNEDDLIILNPGNTGVYSSKQNKLNLISESDPNKLAWKTRELFFNESKLREVIEVVQHVYQVEIKLAEEDLGNCTITVSFSQQELGAVLNVISNTLDLAIDRVDGTIVLSGEGCD